MKTKKMSIKAAKRITVKEKVIAQVKETKMPSTGHTRTTKYYAWISNGAIKVREYANDSDVEMLFNEYSVAL